MPIALSGGTVIYAVFSAASRASIFAGVTSALLAAGWVNSGASTNATGYKLTGTSPQGLSVAVDIWDPGSGTKISIQFKYPTGVLHALDAGGGTLQIVAGPSQFFISRPASRGDALTQGNIVCGGVPFVPDVAGGADPVCGSAGVNGDATTECWWSSGDWKGNVFGIPDSNLRLALDVSGSDKYEGSYNGSYCAPGGVGSARVISFTFGDALSSGVLYPDGSPLIVEPLVCWGNTNADPIRVRGQLWDAMVVCQAQPIDDTSTVFGSSSLDPGFIWMNYIDNYVRGALYLITGQPSAGGNDSYVY